jgi:hypothetical protein
VAALTPQDVYNQLLAAGASTTQAGGILANSINESNISPEAIGDQGTSFGFVQEHGNYGYLVTGNAATDIAAQINLLKSQGAFASASGSSIADAAGNFAANFEKCVGCQPGGAQYSSRVANASTVQNWISGGKWPQSAGSGSSGGSSGGSPTATTAGITIPGLGTIPGIGSLSPSSIASGFINGILNATGLGSVKDLMERAGLLILGFALVIIGIKILAGGSGVSTNNYFNTPQGEAQKTSRKKSVGGKAGKAAKSTGAEEALEAAVVA